MCNKNVTINYTFKIIDICFCNINQYILEEILDLRGNRRTTKFKHLLSMFF